MDLDQLMCVLYSERDYEGEVQILHLDSWDDTYKVFPTAAEGLPAPMATIGSFECGLGVTLKILRSDEEASFSSGQIGVADLTSFGTNVSSVTLFRYH